jgi:hypothetical protein
MDGRTAVESQVLPKDQCGLDYRSMDGRTAVWSHKFFQRTSVVRTTDPWPNTMSDFLRFFKMSGRISFQQIKDFLFFYGR